MQQTSGWTSTCVHGGVTLTTLLQTLASASNHRSLLVAGTRGKIARSACRTPCALLWRSPPERVSANSRAASSASSNGAAELSSSLLSGKSIAHLQDGQRRSCGAERVGRCLHQHQLHFCRMHAGFCTFALGTQGRLETRGAPSASPSALESVQFRSIHGNLDGAIVKRSREEYAKRKTRLREDPRTARLA